MRSLRILTLLCLCSVPAWATWTVNDGVSTVRSCAISAGTTCNITVASTTAGTVEAACASIGAASTTVTFTGDGTWVSPSGGAATQGAHSAQCAYNLNATGGATSITCTVSASTTGNCFYLNLSHSLSSVTFDVANVQADSTACTSCAGVMLSLATANNYFFITAADTAANVTAISGSYSLLATAHHVTAYILNQTTDGAPTFTVGASSVLAASALAIYEYSSGGNAPTQIGAFAVGP
jgi:hypothetical protein